MAAAWLALTAAADGEDEVLLLLAVVVVGGHFRVNLVGVNLSRGAGRTRSKES